MHRKISTLFFIYCKCLIQFGFKVIVFIFLRLIIIFRVKGMTDDFAKAKIGLIQQSMISISIGLIILDLLAFTSILVGNILLTCSQNEPHKTRLWNLYIKCCSL